MASQPPEFTGQGPRVGRLPQPIDTGAPAREGLDALGNAISGAAERHQQTGLQAERINYERQVQQATGSTAASLADLSGQLNVDLLGLREQSQPGAAGHEDAVNQRLAQFRGDATALLGSNPELQARFSDNIASIAATARTGEVEWAMQQRATQSVLDGDKLQSSLQSNLRTAIAGGTFNEQMLKDGDTLDHRYVDAQPIPGTKKAEWLQERHDARLVTVISARTDVDPHAVLADIDAGKYGELDDKVLGPLRNHAREMANQLDSKALAAGNAAAAAENAKARNLIEDVKGGVHVDSVQLQAHYDAVKDSQKAEDISLAHDLGIALAKNGTTAKFDNATLDQRRAAIAEIETHKGWQDDPKLVAAHDQLGTLNNRDAAAAEKDPLTLYQRQTGQDIGALDLHDPAAMARRFRASDLAAKRYEKGIASPFTEAEADQLRTQYNQGTTDAKAGLILGFGAYGSTRARQMMFQIAPTKPELVRLAELAAAPDPAVKALVKEAADGSAVPMKEGVAAAVRNSAQRDYGPAMQRMPGDRQQAILQVASWIYAHRAAAAGKAAVLDPDLAHEAVGAALGGTGTAAGSKGGVGNRNGAPVVLPMGATQDDFDRVLAIGAGHPDVVRQAANGVPKWLNGQDMTTRQFLDLVPVQINDTGSQTLYAFRSKGGSGYVKNERGDDYVLDLRRMSALLNRHSSIDEANLHRYGYVRR